MNTDTYKQKLEEEKTTLRMELGKLGNSDDGQWEARPEKADPSEMDPNSQADRFEDFEEKSATIVPLEARLGEVEAALARIENGTFGKCSVCGGPIEEERLNANPAATTCMAHLG